jgi:Plasmid encoded RepA protein
MRDLTPIEFRRLETSLEIQDNPAEAIAYQHTVFCQTCLPYKDCHDLRTWERRQGCVYLRVEAGAVRLPTANHYSDVGLPYGSRPRLILAHLNRESILNNSPKIEVEASLTAFIKRVISSDSINSREINRFKEQLTRFAACNIRMSVDLPDNRAFQIQTHIIDAMELWLTKNENQRVLWPAFVELSPRYFESLQKHAVPLDERAIAALSNSPMALDVYAWLAQRLCRVGRPQLIPWSALKDQFGFGFSRMDNFKAAFRQILHEVHGQYRQANFNLDDRGMILHDSPPPVRRVLSLCRG